MRRDLFRQILIGSFLMLSVATSTALLVVLFRQTQVEIELIGGPIPPGKYRISLSGGEEKDIELPPNGRSKILLSTKSGESSLELLEMKNGEWVVIGNCGYFGDPLLYRYSLSATLNFESKDKISCFEMGASF